MQRQELLADKNIDMRPVRVRTGRMFLDGFAAIRAQEAELDVPIFAAMSPTDQARWPPSCLPGNAGTYASDALSVIWRLFCQPISKGHICCVSLTDWACHLCKGILEHAGTAVGMLMVCWAFALHQYCQNTMI